MMTSIVVFNTQMYNIKLRSSKLIKSDAQRKWLNLVLDENFISLNILKFIFFFFIFLQIIVHLSAPSHKFKENHQFNVILTYY